MAKAREIVKRRKAARNIYKITKVMQMVATARFQRALKRSKGTRPYLEKLNELVGNVLRGARGAPELQRHPLLKARTPLKRAAVLVVTSNRGLAGGYNSQILRLAMQTIHELEQNGAEVDIHVAGRKGAAYFRFAQRPAVASYTTLSDNPKYEELTPVAQRLMDDYAAEKVDAVKVVYMRFFSVGQQRPNIHDVLPLCLPEEPHDKTLELSQTPKITAAPEFEPEAGQLLIDLVPTLVRAAVFQAFVDAAVSEQIARMLAMAAAKENAESMNKLLTREYNRARQAQITSELSELMGGVEALK
ncbi:MAG TPA: ATP synthase F1 subunit gamma [Phycisphaerae bacterium]|nr:ATP synthase F1 subunit gamma [Phycisphaerae bacterium]